jgi:transcriptional regulator with XRE-family HTH domain
MRKARKCPSLAPLGEDIKAARDAMKLSRKDLAEMVGIAPRYLANIENSGSLPSLPIFYELVKICKLPLERYFFDIPELRDSEQRQRVNHKLGLCDESFLPIIEGAIDGTLKVQDGETEAGN